mmetsp:Transcript_3047/g.8763  ORF Transcript_3047/g.8763 Transcript_3047/m.8763 type:complete len:261 (-) Transcript_3047:53-835(-)
MTNTLRGGKRTYGDKTLLGSWVERGFGGDRPQRDVSNPQFLTTAMVQQTDILRGQPPRFGCALPPPESGYFDWNNVIAPDTRVDPKTYESVQSAVFKAPADENATNEFSSTFHLKGGIKDDQTLEAYRSQWTRDTVHGRNQRFQTSANAGPGEFSALHSASQSRALPGAPLGLDKIRSKLLSSSTTPSASAPSVSDAFLTAFAGCAQSLTPAALRTEVKARLGVSLSELEVDAVAAYLNGGTVSDVSIDDLAASFCLDSA